MSKTLSSLSDDQVRQIALLVETLDGSTFDFLQLKIGDLEVTIGKGGVPSTAAALPGVLGASAGTVPLTAAPAVPAITAPLPLSSAQPTNNEGSTPDGTVAIVAPMMGRFYAKPEPGVAPFVLVGAKVDADTTVGLIEVMKVFTAVRADVTGVVTEICVQDAQFVEHAQLLFRVRPA